MMFIVTFSLIRRDRSPEGDGNDGTIRFLIDDSELEEIDPLKGTETIIKIVFGNSLGSIIRRDRSPEGDGNLFDNVFCFKCCID